MQTTYETALNEFRDASAAVRQAFGRVSAARETQIIADSEHRAASNALSEAHKRMAEAETALSRARDGASPEPVLVSFHEPKIAGRYSIDPDGGIAIAEPVGTAATITTQGALAAQSAPAPQPATIDAHANGLGIG